MQNTKEIAPQNKYLVRRVSLTDSIKSIPVGETALYSSLEAGPMSSARSAISRLNKTSGREQYTIATADNGVTYSITHIA